MKIDIEQIETTLLERKVEPLKVKEILKDLIQAAEEDKEDNAAEKGPKLKNEFLIVLNDPEGKIKDEFTGWVITQSEGMDSSLALSKLTDAVRNQNEVTKKKKNIIKSFSELFHGLKPKSLKEKGIKIKTKEAVRVILVNGNTL